MADRPKMPVPTGDLSPKELCSKIKSWAKGFGYEFELESHGHEYGRAVVRDPAGGLTSATVPNAHKGRKLRRDQVRYTVQDINRNWKE